MAVLFTLPKDATQKSRTPANSLNRGEYYNLLAYFLIFSEHIFTLASTQASKLITDLSVMMAFGRLAGFVTLKKL